MFDNKTRDIAVYFAVSTAIIFAAIAAIQMLEGGYIALGLVLAGGGWIDYEGLSLICGERHFNLIDAAVVTLAKFIMGAFALLMFFASHKLVPSEIHDVLNTSGVLIAFLMCDGMVLSAICVMRWLYGQNKQPEKPE
jgi:hypothetical protein